MKSSRPTGDEGDVAYVEAALWAARTGTVCGAAGYGPQAGDAFTSGVAGALHVRQSLNPLGLGLQPRVGQGFQPCVPLSCGCRDPRLQYCIFSCHFERSETQFAIVVLLLR